MSSSDRRPYLSATTLSQTVLDACHDNLESQIEMAADIESSTGFIYASDRNKYVGQTFYEALLVFPLILRTVGEWLSNDLQFSSLTLELSNVDGRFNSFSPGGDDFGGWIDNEVRVRVGIAEVEASYLTIFKGNVTPVGGFKRTIKSIILTARDAFDRLNAKFPTVAFTVAVFPRAEDKVLGKLEPVIYGDWTTDFEPAPAVVPTYCTNGNDPFVAFKPKDFTVTIASPAVVTCERHGLDDGDIIQITTSGTLPTGLAVATNYYVRNSTDSQFNLSLAPAGPLTNTTGAQSGTHQFVPDPTGVRENLELTIASNDLTFFDQGQVYLKRQELYYLAPTSEIVNVGPGNRYFELKQSAGGTWVEAGPFLFQSGDEIFVRVKGEDLSGYDDNVVAQAKHILVTYGGAIDPTDFDASWATFRDKATPAESNIAAIKSRAHITDQEGAINYALSLLEQVRLEAFVNRDQKLQINSLHFEDWDDAPDYAVKNWDVVQGTFQTSIDERNNFNRCQGVYNLLPDVNENSRATAFYRNNAAITQAGREIAKRVVFPNLYRLADVQYQTKEILKLASSTLETINVSLTWRAMLLDIGEFIRVDVQIGATIFENVPCMVRDIGYDPDGLKIVVRLWSLQMTNFPGWTPGYTGITGGYDATLTEES